MLRLAEHWVWDSWMADDGERYHLFFLKAPRALEDPRLRHAAATIGHATSVDLVDWEVGPDALGPAEAGRGWGDLAAWTGSVARGDDGVWRMYYTALSTKPGYGVKDQRIGVAESGDLWTWRRTAGPPLVAPDPRWYMTLPEDSRASETWRDPFVLRDPAGNGWHMLITARAPGVPRLRDGVVGHARSADMLTWELRPPITAPVGFGQIEVPQVRVVDGTPLLVFCCHPEEQAPEQIERYGRYCTWYIAGESVLGPWDIDSARPFTGEPSLFGAPLVQRRDGSWAFVGFLNTEPEGHVQFELLDPIPVVLTGDELRRAGGVTTS